ncbi:MAG: flagellar biosynthesis protein FlgL [Rhodobacteraceae bacterium]|jgi:flagellar hook-associated protein 3 FlgL|uniref:flagellin n=1 Tax=Albidovulum sp. TaxID=1872424 RepID=UPI001DBEB7A6|nr:flagellin [uncultured Defluviimonas sp.]MCB2124183.1 flagellar biosynthesis protein FlgL [Paracoccaceae bacterium]MCC0070969.1 flagellar biosynthesis protein FlgL [Paracoccaceae bacterium]
MHYLSVGDLAQAYQMRRHNAALQTHLARLTEEMTTGVRSDLAEAVSGDFRALAGLDRSLATLAAYKTATDEAALLTQTVQSALETVQELATDLGPGLLSAATTGTPTLMDTTAGDARQKFASVVSALNTQVADRYLLSGTATDRKPIADADSILSALGVATAGQVTAAGVASAVAAWFDAPSGGGGFLDAAYGGAAAPFAPFGIGAGESATMDLTAADPAIRDLLEGFALGALVAEGTLSGDDAGRAVLLRRSGEALLAAGNDMAAVRARVGSVEARIAGASARNAAEASALQIARNGLVAADPYDTATAIQAVQTQIETLYTLTARLSRLSLTDYLG